MKIKQAGTWRNIKSYVKANGSWFIPMRIMSKVAGVWKDDHLKGVLNSLYSGTITLGTFTSSYVGVGYASSVGSASPTATKFVNEMTVFITGNKPYYGAPAHQWIEMAVAGDIRHLEKQIGDITVNGIYGRLVSISVGGTGGSRTFLGWVFDRPLPLTGQWVVRT